MNKTLSVNIGGIVFHIEEQAYDKLNRYLEAIKGYFTICCPYYRNPNTIAVDTIISVILPKVRRSRFSKFYPYSLNSLVRNHRSL